jgi:hypothetical protein
MKSGISSRCFKAREPCSAGTSLCAKPNRSATPPAGVGILPTSLSPQPSPPIPDEESEQTEFRCTRQPAL